MEKKLTVVITTYNRKDPLLAQLRSLERQGHFDQYEICISDNHSDYDVRNWLESQLTSDFMDIIRIKRWELNVGHELNATFAFLLPQTEWMWLLSDDDITEPNSLEIVLNDISKVENENVCWIKYSISGFPSNEESYISSVKDIFEYYGYGNKSTGEWIFMSNNVYQLKYLKPYYSTALIYSDNVQEPEVLPLFAIKNDNRQVFFSAKALTNYIPGRASYNLIWVYSRVSNILFSGLNLNKIETNAFKKMRFISIRTLMRNLSVVENKALRNEYFKKIYFAHFRLFSFRGIKCLLAYAFLNIKGTWR